MSDISDTQGLETAQLRLNTLENSRKSFARIIRLYARGELDRVLFRDLTYGFTGYLAYWKLEKDIEIESRLDAIEQAIERQAKS
mgnify:CR=1 FL=1